MMGYVADPVLLDDEKRLDRLRDCSVLDTPRELVFDRFVFTLAQLVRVPIALVGLADRDRHWFKAHVGVSFTEWPLSMSLCGSLLTAGDSLVVEDLTLDSRFADHPLVAGSPHLRFFAAVPLIASDGLRLGTLCVADHAPKTLLSRQVGQMQGIAHSVAAALEARRLPGL